MAGVALVVKAGDAAGSRLEVDGELLIGRSAEGPGLLGGDPRISRRHARIVRVDGGLLVEDLGSTNGTFVNGARLEGSRPLSPGDEIRLGRTTVEVETADQPSSTEHAQGESMADLFVRVREQIGSPSALGEVSVASSAPAVLLHSGRRVAIPPEGLTIGSRAGSDILISSGEVAAEHASVLVHGGRHFLADLGTGVGTQLNGEWLRRDSRWLNPGDTITVAGERLRFLTGAATRAGEVREQSARIGVVRLEGGRLEIGRDPSNDVVLDDPNVSRFHAEVVVRGDMVELRDLGSRNGTRLDGRPAQRERLLAGAEIGVGPYRLLFDGQSFVRRDDHGALRLDARGVTVSADGQVILNSATLAVEPGEFVAVIGESGSGKSTLVRALAGVARPARGEITVNGDPVLNRLTDLGYVPQDEIVHRHLAVREALSYAARLRLPGEGRDLDAAVERVLDELSLAQHADTRIGSLSGGQRKRAGMAAELLSRPSLLFLDEPTTGLDPGLETRMMELFRSLAEPGVRAVVVVTHATRNLDLADRVCVLGRGGELCFFGTPDGARLFFEAESYDDVYRALERHPASEWRRRFEETRREPPRAAAPPVRYDRRRPGARPLLAQTRVLAERYARLILRDSRNLAILLGQVPVIALAIALLFKGDPFAVPRGSPSEAAQLLFLLVTTAVWLGSIDGSREIVKERGLASRERAVGVRVGAYLISKAVVLFPLAVVQTGVLALIVLALRPLHEPSGTYVVVLALLALTSFTAVGMGLLLSALARSEDQATSLIPLVLIPQLLFAGAIVSVARMGDLIALVSNGAFSRWAFAGLGSVAEMNDRLRGDPAALAAYGTDFFDLSSPVAALVLIGFMAVLLVAVRMLLERLR